MLPATENLTLYRGDSVDLTRRFKDQNGDYFDLTGCEPKAQVRSTSSSPETLIEFVCAITDQTAMRGGVTLKTAAGITGALPAASLWDMQLTHPDGSVRTYLAGTVTASGQVTL